MSRTASNAEVPGWYIEFQANVLRQLPRPGEIDATTAMGWNQNQKALKRFLAQALMSIPTYKVVVDYSKSLSEMINLGEYGHVSDAIDDRYFSFVGVGQHEVELVLVHLGRPAWTKEVLEEMSEQGLEPAKIEHLLAFGAKYKDIQCEFPIVALGSYRHPGSVRGYCPCLDKRMGRREIQNDSDSWGSSWKACHRFLAIRKAT
jgi:hypothetical protein